MATKNVWEVHGKEGGTAKFQDVSGTMQMVLNGTAQTATTAEINSVVGGNTATAAEITRAADLTGRVVDLDATSLSVTEALHEGRIITLSHTAAESTVTLPEATGTGARYRFIVAAVNTNNHKITTADATNASFYGSVNILDLDGAAQGGYAPAATDELITLNGTTTGGAIGDYIEVIDMATDKWMVTGQLQVPTGSNPATPFSGA